MTTTLRWWTAAGLAAALAACDEAPAPEPLSAVPHCNPDYAWPVDPADADIHDDPVLVFAENDPDDPDDADDEAPSRAPRFYARAQRGVLQPDGSERTMTVLLTPRGSLVARAAERQGSAAGQGASLAAADVDADGALDVLTSDFIREGQEDRLRWFRVTPDGRLTLVWESPRTTGSVLHSAAGDFLGTGRSVFVAFETRARGGSRVWVVD